LLIHVHMTGNTGFVGSSQSQTISSLWRKIPFTAVISGQVASKA